MADIATLHKAKGAKNDEFYTRITEVAKELIHYKEQFRGKVIYCNCDDPTYSAFWEYLHTNFGVFGLKKLICTHYSMTEQAYKMEYTGGNDKTLMAGIKTPLEGNGDFRNAECIAILEEADIIVTNPPFSLFREYVAQLVKYKKKFLIIGNMNALTYKEIFPLFRDNKLWYGISIHSSGRKFYVPDDYPFAAYEYGVDETGRRYVVVTGIRWFTNLDYPARHKELMLQKHYTPAEYPKYDNYDAINVNRYRDIPKDYYGVMGVPISFMDFYCPEQFEILDINPHFFTLVEQGLSKPKQLTLHNAGYVKDPYARVLIRRKRD